MLGQAPPPREVAKAATARTHGDSAFVAVMWLFGGLSQEEPNFCVPTSFPLLFGCGCRPRD